MASRWLYDGELGAQDGQLGSILGAILAHRSHLGANFNENVKKQKTSKNLWFFNVFGGLGGPSGAIWRPCSAMLAHLGDKMGYLGPSWRYVAPSWRQDGAQEPQDEPKSAKRSQHERKRPPT